MTTKTMESTGLKKELLDLERQYWQAVKDKDAKTMIELTDDPCIIAGASGVMKVDRAMLKKIIDSASYTLNRFEIDDAAEMRQMGDDLAILAYKVHEELTVDGKPVAMDAADTSLWRRRDGRWVNAMHTESLLGDAYGRDRSKPM